MRNFLLGLLGARQADQRSFIIGESLSVAIAQIFGILLVLVLNISWVRFLGPREFGHYSFAQSWVNILAVVGSMGFGTANVRLIPKYLVGSRWGELAGLIRGSLGLTALMSLVVAGLFMLVVPKFYDTAQSSYFLVSGILIIPVSLLLVTSGTLKGFKKIFFAQCVSLVVRPLLMLLAIGLFTFLCKGGTSASWGIGINLFASICALVFLLFIIRPTLMKYVRGHVVCYQFKEWFSYSLPLVMIVGINVINNRIGVLAVGMHLGPEVTGQYAACLQISLLAGFGLVVVGMVAQPILSEQFTRNDFEQIGHTLRVTARGALFLSLPITLVIILAGKWVLNLMDESYVEAYPVLVVLTLGQVSSVLFGQVGTLLVMTDKQRSTMYILGASAMMHILLLVLLVPRMGIMGAGLSSGLVILFWNSLMSIVVLRKLGLRATAF